MDETWTDGFLVGGMASAPDDREIARSYREAAELMLDFVKADREVWRVAYPILFLYRHALELLLKAVIRPGRPSQGLAPLVEALDELLATRFQQTLPDFVRSDLLAFSRIDPDSQAFRYARHRSGDARYLEGEYWFSWMN